MVNRLIKVFILTSYLVVVTVQVCKNPTTHTSEFIEKISFTQKGYIQFLKYVKQVPVITEYTFCLWMRSHNLTYNHPLLSYSKHENERLIRVWLTKKGRSIKLEINNIKIFEIPLNISECQWHHYCQSWSSYMGAWNLFLDGKLYSYGYVPQLKSSFIKGGGDVVVGQEYTDFDKGLDDGIEGDIYGFNFALSPTMKILNSKNNRQLKPLGLHLVQSSYNCYNKKSNKNFFINWNVTPVRIYGGAVLKKIHPFC